MCGVRKNTLVIDFSVLPARPEIGKIQTFLDNVIKVRYEDVISIQLHHARNCVYVEMKSYEIASRYQSEHNWKRTMLCADKEFRIPIYVDCEAVTVRVHDLPPSVSHSAVGEFMLKFGEVISIRDETWMHYFPGISNGVRVLRMNLLRHIPSYVTIANEITMISYENQPKSCRHCHEPIHPGKKCVESNNAAFVNHPRTASTASSPPSDGLFTEADFPPINKAQKAPTVEETKQNDDEWTDIDDNASTSSSSDFIEATNKRRRSKREKAETKKVCSEQCSPNRSSKEHATGASSTQVFSLKNKSSNGSK
ncbi:uncharacterized protein LOC134285253 [Aedes albopictus]|uniref:Translation elongation factor ef-1 alpha/tu n=1 Tax=Aedes albopictus TaxID=7160 RepID=A0ABM1YPP7_AEDAL